MIRGNVETAVLTLLALLAFASNSLLTRLALGSHQIDAATFTSIRLGAGAFVLALVVRVRAGNWAPLRGGGLLGPLALFTYAAPFSFAYLRIGAAVGALVAFGVVQLTMIGYGVFKGERPAPLAWVGLCIATLGLGALTIKSAARPDPLGVLLMAIAGAAWGVYSIAGKQARDPIAANARSFLAAAPLALIVNWATPSSQAASPRGVLLALISGAVTSALGYAIWYRALAGLAVTRAAVAQLSVPIIAALGATAFLGERLSLRLVLTGSAILGGVALVLSARSRDPL